MDYDVGSNRYNIKCMRMSILISWGILLLNELGIFIVSKSIVRNCIFVITVILVCALIVIRIAGIDKAWIKYIILFAEVLGITVFSTFLTYHALLMFALPFLMAAHYTDRKVTVFTYIISVIGLVASIILGYEYGVCDMNMVGVTTDSLQVYGSQVVYDLHPLGKSKIIDLMVFYAMPRSIILCMFAGMALTIAKKGYLMHEEEEKARRDSKIDKMTGLYNKGEYLSDIKYKYSELDHIGVIFIDINNLKVINDTFGHDKGDEAIIKVAKSISYLIEEGICGYRIGGDEFVIFVENASNARLKAMAMQWQRFLEIVNEEDSSMKVTAAYGYSYGKGKDLAEIIEEADKNMYVCKKEMKEGTHI